MNREQVITDVFGLYEQHGTADYIGEPVSQLEHMSQAAQLAMAEGFDDEVVLAAFFHDIGHLCGHGGENMGGYGVVSHERLGADYLRRAGFSERMATLVEYHVQAKRYLTYSQPDYYARLSEASRRTLAYQGGDECQGSPGIRTGPAVRREFAPASVGRAGQGNARAGARP